MTPNGERSIRNIPVSAGSHRRNAAPQERFEEDTRLPDGQVPLPKRRKRSRRWLWWTIGIIAVCVVAGLLLSTLFEGATVTITPKMQQVTPPANIVALPNASTGSLAYQTVSLAQSATTTTTASGTTHVSKAANGPITISNTAATKQALITNTRFEAPNGNVYRIHTAVTVPAKGSVIATVYADQPGATYNLGSATSFTIPGFKGDPRFSTITAATVANAISGGLVGDQPAVSTADMQVAQAKLQSQLDASLRSSVSSQVPEGFMPVQGSLNVTYSDIAMTPGEGTSVSLSQTANASMAMVSGTDLASILAKLLVSGYGGEPVAFKTPNPLVLQLGTTTSSSTTGPLTILLQGTPTLVWQFDQNALKTALLGKDKTAFQTAIEQFSPAIEKAQASIRPFWKSTFPTDASKLDIDIQE